MEYTQYSPDPRLAQFVECIWVQEDLRKAPPGGWPSTRVLPTTKTDLVLFYADPFVTVDREIETAVPRFSLTGQWTSPVDLKATGASGVIVMSFYPWGAFPFFGLPMSQIADQHLAIENLMGKKTASRIYQQVCEAGPAAQRIGVIEALLVRLLKEDRHDSLIEAAAREVNRLNGTVPISRLAEQFHISRRQLVRRFRATVGATPKTFARINRFQKALGRMRQGRDWNTILSECSYFDQSHLIRDVGKFSGYSPGKIVRDLKETGLMRYYNRRPEMSHFYNTTYFPAS